MTTQIDPLLPQQHTPIPERGTYIPSWCPWHAKGWDTNRAVHLNSEPLGFKVSDVLPERRWAILETGDIMDQRSFEDDYLRYMTGFGLPSFVDPKFEPMPRAERFVAKTFDPVDPRRLMDIGFDPLKPAEQSLEAKHDQEGNVSRHYLEEQKAAQGKLSKIDLLNDLLAKGAITKEQFAEMVGGITTEADELPRAAHKSNCVEPVSEPKSDLGPVAIALCGAEKKPGASIRMQEMKCKRCINLKAVARGDA